MTFIKKDKSLTKWKEKDESQRGLSSFLLAIFVHSRDMLFAFLRTIIGTTLRDVNDLGYDKAALDFPSNLFIFIDHLTKMKPVKWSLTFTSITFSKSNRFCKNDYNTFLVLHQAWILYESLHLS